MTFRLTKHHGLGNDFLVHLTDDPVAAADREAWVERAPRWCDRRRGIGADGLLIGAYGDAAPDGVDLVMTLVNADGSVAEMSGNGIRCLVQAESRRRGTAEGELSVATDAGARLARYRPDPVGDPSSIVASVEMGPARPGPEPDRDLGLDGPDLAPGTAERLGLAPLRRATYDVGNPHLVLLVPDPEVVDIATAGPTHEAAYSGGINVHFVAPDPARPDTMAMRVWERGAGITEACGTGATTVARAAHDWGLTGAHVTVRMPGGDVVVDVADTMTLHGPASFIADVTVPS